MAKEDDRIDMTSYATHQLVTQMKHELCYCGEPRDHQLVSYTLPDGESIDIDEESMFPFKAPEWFFFDPMRLDWEDTSLEMSVPDMVRSSCGLPWRIH